MSNVILLINEGVLHTFTPALGAMIKYRTIGRRRYNDIVRECRIEDRGPKIPNKDAIARIVREVLNEDGSLKPVSDQTLTERVFALLAAEQTIGRTDWSAVQIRALLWAVESWEGIGFDPEQGAAPLNETSISAFADTSYGEELFKLVLSELNTRRAEEGNSDPLGRSESTSLSPSTLVGDTAEPATTTTSKTGGNRHATKTVGTASTQTSRPSA